MDPLVEDLVEHARSLAQTCEDSLAAIFSQTDPASLMATPATPRGSKQQKSIKVLISNMLLQLCAADANRNALCSASPEWNRRRISTAATILLAAGIIVQKEKHTLALDRRVLAITPHVAALVELLNAMRATESTLLEHEAFLGVLATA